MSSKKTKTQTMIEQNNVLREKLNAENKAYYEQLLLYIRTHGLFYNDYEVETLLLQILQDILSAQTDGQTAEDFFGSNPQEAADELIKQLGKASQIEIWKMVGIIFGVSSFFTIISALSDPKKGINGLVLLFNALLSFLVIEFAFFFIHKSIYRRLFKNRVASYIIGCFVGAAIIGLFMLILWLTPPLLVFIPSNGLVIPVLVLLMTTATVYVFLQPRKERKLWLPFLPYIYVIACCGILARISPTAIWMASRTGKFIAAWIIIAAFIFFSFLTWLLGRDKKNAA
ncbi:MAG: DUF1129 family protein [Sporolactobacillus sp.]